MNVSTQEQLALAKLKQTMESYEGLSDETWSAIRKICSYRDIEKRGVLYEIGKVPSTFSFVYTGLFRVVVIDDNGNEYNKNFFDEGTFPGSMAALLTNSPSRSTIEAIEHASILEIDFREYRKLLLEYDDLKLFQIYYLEKNWLIAKDKREIGLVQDNATQRYQRFILEYPHLVERIPQYHIASHLGITPTQLSRIRKNMNISTYVNEP